MQANVETIEHSVAQSASVVRNSVEHSIRILNEALRHVSVGIVKIKQLRQAPARGHAEDAAVAIPSGNSIELSIGSLNQPCSSRIAVIFREVVENFEYSSGSDLECRSV